MALHLNPEHAGALERRGRIWGLLGRRLEPLTPLSLRWQVGAIPVARFVNRVDDLAARFGFDVHTWDEDGLGARRGGSRVGSRPAGCSC